MVKSTHAWTVLGAVDLAVVEVVLVGEVRLERQMVAADATLEALLVEDHLVDGADLLDRIYSLIASRTLLGRWRNEQLAKTLRGRSGRRQRSRVRRGG